MSANDNEVPDYPPGVCLGADHDDNGIADDASVSSFQRKKGNRIVKNTVLSLDNRVVINGEIEQPTIRYQLNVLTWNFVAGLYAVLPPWMQNIVRLINPPHLVWVFATKDVAAAFRCKICEIPSITPAQLFAIGVAPLILCESKYTGPDSVLKVIGGDYSIISSVDYRSGLVLIRPLGRYHSADERFEEFVLVRHNPNGYGGNKYCTPEDISGVDESGTELIQGPGGGRKVPRLQAHLMALQNCAVRLIYDKTSIDHPLIGIIKSHSEVLKFFGCQSLANALMDVHLHPQGKPLGDVPGTTDHLYLVKPLPFGDKSSAYTVVSDAVTRRAVLTNLYNSDEYVTARSATQRGHSSSTVGKACMIYDDDDDKKRDTMKFPSVRKAVNNLETSGIQYTLTGKNVTHERVEEATRVNPQRGLYFSKKKKYLRLISDEQYYKVEVGITDPFPDESNHGRKTRKQWESKE